MAVRARWRGSPRPDAAAALQQWPTSNLAVEGPPARDCFPFDSMASYLARRDTQQELHLGDPVNHTTFAFRSSGPAPITLYPTLVKYLRVFIYNGDDDPVVPFTSDSEWTQALAKSKILVETRPWHAWYEGRDPGNERPAGYATGYSVPNAASPNSSLTYLTIKMAGHMVPMFQPWAALAMFKSFVSGIDL